MNKNYKLQITNKAAPFGQVLNAFGEGDAHELHELTRITERNYNGKITTKGSHSLHQDTFKLQTMTALIKSFCRGVQGGRFFQKESPLAAGGKEEIKDVVLY
jgi:hypothetical protein